MPELTPLQKIQEIMDRHEEELAEAIHYLRQAQKKCKHRQVIEVSYRPSYYGNSDPPYRICVRCGYREKGWYCGYKRLQASTVIRTVPSYEEHMIRQEFRIPVSELCQVNYRYEFGNSIMFTDDK